MFNMDDMNPEGATPEATPETPSEETTEGETPSE